ncbi:MAG: hypothetical protein V1802_02325 [Candidatus Aenigmatarchaeota archaeon]
MKKGFRLFKNFEEESKTEKDLDTSPKLPQEYLDWRKNRKSLGHIPRPIEYLKKMPKSEKYSALSFLGITALAFSLSYLHPFSQSKKTVALQTKPIVAEESVAGGYRDSSEYPTTDDMVATLGDTAALDTSKIAVENIPINQSSAAYDTAAIDTTSKIAIGDTLTYPAAEGQYIFKKGDKAEKIIKNLYPDLKTPKNIRDMVNYLAELNASGFNRKHFLVDNRTVVAEKDSTGITVRRVLEKPDGEKLDAIFVGDTLNYVLVTPPLAVPINQSPAAYDTAAINVPAADTSAKAAADTSISFTEAYFDTAASDSLLPDGVIYVFKKGDKAENVIGKIYELKTPKEKRKMVNYLANLNAQRPNRKHFLVDNRTVVAEKDSTGHVIYSVSNKPDGEMFDVIFPGDTLSLPYPTDIDTTAFAVPAVDTLSHPVDVNKIYSSPVKSDSIKVDTTKSITSSVKPDSTISSYSTKNGDASYASAADKNNDHYKAAYGKNHADVMNSYNTFVSQGKSVEDAYRLAVGMNETKWNAALNPKNL